MTALLPIPGDPAVQALVRVLEEAEAGFISAAGVTFPTIGYHLRAFLREDE